MDGIEMMTTAFFIAAFAAVYLIPSKSSLISVIKIVLYLALSLVMVFASGSMAGVA